MARFRDGDGDRGGDVCTFTPSAFLRVPFEAGNFDRDPTAERMNLAIECDDELKAFATAFDAWVVKYLAEHSERIFKRRMSLEQVRGSYSSCLKPPPEGKDYPPTIKTKIDVSGTRAVRCWDETTGEQTTAPKQWRNTSIRPRLLFSHLWIMGAQCGAVVKVTDVQVGDTAAVDGSTTAARVVVNPFK